MPSCGPSGDDLYSSCVHGGAALIQIERENFHSPFSQWLTRTRLGGSHQPGREWLSGSGRQPSGLCATQNTAWCHQHLGSMNGTGCECGQNRGSQNKMPFIPQCPGLACKDAGNGWSSRPTLFHQQSMRPHAELHQKLQLIMVSMLRNLFQAHKSRRCF